MSTPRWSETTAIFGGTFDPPHLGHLEAIQGLFQNPGIKQVLLLPSPIPPHKVSVANTEQRLEMTRLLLDAVLASKCDARIDTIELDRARSKTVGEFTYTFDTVQELKREIPQLAFVMGVDQLEKFHTWYRYMDLLGSCHWIILDRKPNGRDRALSVIRAWEGSGLLVSTRDPLEWRISSYRGPSEKAAHLRLVQTTARDVSSTWIREQIAKTGGPPEGTLLESVTAYLKRRRIYGSS